MNRKETLQAAAAVALVMGLGGCGGGTPISTFGGPLDRTGNTPVTGGSGPTLSGTSGSGNYNMQAGIANMVANGLTVNVTLSGSLNINGTGGTVSGSGIYTLSAGMSTTFNGSTALAQTQSLTTTNATVGGQPFSISENVTSYYASSTSYFLGQVSTEYDVAESPFQYPTSVGGGLTGSLGTILRYSDSTMSTSTGTAAVTYVVTAPTVSGGPVSIVITTKIYNTGSSLIETDTTTYSMTSANVISYVSWSAQNQSGTLVQTAN